MKKPLVTVIIPARNEEFTLSSVLHSLSRQNRISDCQVLVVDGMSTDGTSEVATRYPFVEVVRCEPGRVCQMNYGASVASGDILWFLHSDSTFPERTLLDSIIQTMEAPDVVGGAFRFHLRGDDIYYKIVNFLVNLRSRSVMRVFSDQGIFVRASAFKSLGGFRLVESCEDIDIVLRMRQAGAFRLLPQRVETSARTWQRYGKVRTTWWHLRELFLYEWNRRYGSKTQALPAPGSDSTPAVPVAAEPEPPAPTSSGQ